MYLIKWIVPLVIRIQHKFDGFWIGERVAKISELRLRSSLVLARAFTELNDLF